MTEKCWLCRDKTTVTVVEQYTDLRGKLTFWDSTEEDCPKCQSMMVTAFPELWEEDQPYLEVLR